MRRTDPVRIETDPGRAHRSHPSSSAFCQSDLRLLDPSRGAELSDREPWFVDDLEGLATPYSEWSWEDLLFPSRRPPSLEILKLR